MQFTTTLLVAVFAALQQGVLSKPTNAVRTFSTPNLARNSGSITGPALVARSTDSTDAAQDDRSDFMGQLVSNAVNQNPGCAAATSYNGYDFSGTNWSETDYYDGTTDHTYPLIICCGSGVYNHHGDGGFDNWAYAGSWTRNGESQLTK